MPPTPYMGLTLPTVGVTLGPEWATEVNAAFVQVDAHNHTTGQGVPIPTNGISINADLPLNGYNTTLVRSNIFVNNTSPLSLVTDIGSLYVAGGNLYYNNTIGQQVQITQGAGLDASTVGGFGGDYGTSTASAFYTSATSTFTFWQAPNQSALMDFGPFTIHNTSSIATGITIQAPNPLASSYTLTLPNSLPSSTKILTVDNAGNIGDVYDVDNVTIQVSSNTLQVVPGSIGPTQLAPLNFLESSSSTTFTTSSNAFVPVPPLSVSFTGSGRPVMLMLGNDQTGNSAFLGVTWPTNNSTFNGVFFIEFLIDGSSIGVQQVGEQTGGLFTPITANNSFPPSMFQQFYSNPTAGAHTYSVNVKVASTVGSLSVANCILIVYEL
jgi:hypothetical protein